MLRYGMTVRQAVSAFSYLVEKENEGPIGSAEVAENRDLPLPLAAKLLSEISKAGYLSGVTGPGGGYSLAKNPEEISLAEIVSLFETQSEDLPCPFGPHWCGTGEQCPLHDQLESLQKESEKFLTTTMMSVFRKKANDEV